MQFTIDDKLKLLAGQPIYVESFGYIVPKKIRDLIDIGYSNYMKLLNMMIVTRTDLNEELPEELSDFEVIFYLGDETVRELMKESLEFFLNEQVHLFLDKGVLAVGSDSNALKIISKKNFDDIRKVVQVQNFLGSIDNLEESRKKDEKAKVIAERLKQAQNEVQRIKKKENQGEDESDFFDLLSAVSCKSNSLNIFQILDLTVFQLYEEFKRLSLIDQYHTNIQAMLQGAKNVKLKHWSSKIKY